MKTWITSVLLATAAPLALAAASIGQPAPAFTATDVDGKAVSLADFKGKTVVLEWVNPGCPYVQKHYGAANMQATQKAAVDQGAVWLTINTTGREFSDYKPPADMAAWMKGHKAAATATLMDSDGRVGRAYGARTTPHMYVINPSGTLVYAGAIDSKPSANVADIAGATNYVKQAVAETVAGKAVTVASTRAYGCTMKYSSQSPA